MEELKNKLKSAIDNINNVSALDFLDEIIMNLLNTLKK